MKRTSLYESLAVDPFEDTEREQNWQSRAKEILKVVISTRLSKKQRQVIVLYYYKGMKQREIAKLLGVTESSVSHIKKKALENIKFYIELLRR